MAVAMAMAMGGAMASLTTVPITRRSAVTWSSLTFSQTMPLLLVSSSSSLHRNKQCRGVGLHGEVDMDNDDDESCELVSGTEVFLGDGDGDGDGNGTNGFRAYLLKAVKNNNGCGVLILSDVYGFEPASTRDFAYRVACNGYNVLVPDLFRGNPWTRGRNRWEFDDWVAQQPSERVVKDVYISAKWMVDELLAAGISEKLGIIGFCFGGGRVMDTLAQDKGSHFSTAVCFYGTHMDVSVSGDITVPVLFICGDSDPLCRVEILRELEKRIERGSKLVVFRGQGHAFVHRPESPEADKDAEEAFSIMRNWLHQALVVNHK